MAQGLRALLLLPSLTLGSIVEPPPKKKFTKKNWNSVTLSREWGSACKHLSSLLIVPWNIFKLNKP